MNKRGDFSSAKRLLFKVGTNSLTNSDGSLNLAALKSLVSGLADIRKSGVPQVILVTSGAVGAGLAALGFKKRPKSLPQLQMAAAVGQSKLMAVYDRLFSKKGINTAQVLLTHDDLKNRSRHINVVKAIESLLQAGVIPIINENDAVSVDEIRVGDNDSLAAMVGIMLKVDLLFFLTGSDGVRKVAPDPASRISHIRQVNKNFFQSTQGKTNQLSTGGMYTKLLAAKRALRVNIPSIIMQSGNFDRVKQALLGADIGTLIGPTQLGETVTRSKQRYLQFFNKTAGELILDQGASKIILRGKASLLAVGISKIVGEFTAGSLLSIKNSAGVEIARGRSKFSSQEIVHLLQNAKKEGIFIRVKQKPVVHHDDLVILAR